jgi:hypothetical protein
MPIYLTEPELGILNCLGTKNQRLLKLKDITQYLNDSEYKNEKGEPISINYTREMLNKLTHYDYVRSKTIQEENTSEPRFYLAGGTGGGVRRRMKVQGRGFFYEPSRLIRNLTGVVFLLAGIGLFLYESPSLTGAVIGTPTNDFIVGAVFIFVGLAFFFIKPKKGEKSKKNKKRK